MKLKLSAMLCFLSLGCVVAVYAQSKAGALDGPSYVEVTDVRGYTALVLVPFNAVEAVNGKYPTILFLHSIGERGNDLNIVRRNGFPRDLEGDQEFPFIFIMPQCPLSTEWYYTNADNVTAMQMFLDDLIGKFPIDTNRIYITGLSMGGIGSWYFAIKLPTRFAAVVPVAFRGDGWSPCPAKDVPVWAFHGANDGVIPFSSAQVLVDQFVACGGNIRFTAYPSGSHDASTWTVTYNNPEVYEWMLRKKKSAQTTVIENSGQSTPEGYALEQNFPNPFNPTTTITFSVGTYCHTSLRVFDILGREVAVLANEDRAPGVYKLTWDAHLRSATFSGKASALPTGVYLYRMQAGDFIETRKMMLTN